MKASELSDTERMAYEQRLAETFERVDRVNESLRERAARRWEDGTEFEERHQERRQRAERDRAVSAQPQPVPPTSTAPPRQETKMDPESSRRWNDWCDKRIVDLLKIHDECIFEDVHEAFLEAREISRTEQRAALDELRARMTANESATVELIRELENRIAVLEQRAVLKPQKPKLIGWSGGGDGAA